LKEFNKIPTSISHKTLNALFIKASKDCSSKDIQTDQGLSQKEEFNQLLTTWNKLSKELLYQLDKNKKCLTEKKSPNSLMALGAMEVHLNMALQALKASELEE